MKKILESFNYPNPMAIKHELERDSKYNYKNKKIFGTTYRESISFLSEKELEDLCANQFMIDDPMEEQRYRNEETRSALLLWGIKENEIGQAKYKKYWKAFSNATEFINDQSELTRDVINNIYLLFTNNESLVVNKNLVSKDGNGFRDFNRYDSDFNPDVDYDVLLSNVDEFIEKANKVKNMKPGVKKILESQNLQYEWLKLSPLRVGNHLALRLLNQWILQDQMSYMRYTSRAIVALIRQVSYFYKSTKETKDLTYSHIFNFYIYKKQIEWRKMWSENEMKLRDITDKQRTVLYNVFMSGVEITSKEYRDIYDDSRTKQQVNNDLRALKTKGFVQSKEIANRTLKYWV